MFVQVIKGRTQDATAVRQQIEKWTTQVRPGATGFLGSTSGVADDGTFIAFVRFDDEASARANAERPERSEWWAETVKLFDGEPTFRESSDVDTVFDGGSDAAGFVQVMEGSVLDRAKAQAMETPELLERLRTARPDLIGSLRVWFADSTYAEAAYFTSEAEARQGEEAADFSEQEEQFAEVYGPMAFIDLRDPIFTSAR